MKPVSQKMIVTDVIKLTIAVCVVIAVWTHASNAQPDSPDTLYTTRAVVTGKDERNRPLGFRLCFEGVLVKVSGDASIVNDTGFDTLAADAGQYVSTFSYRDRFEGKQFNDEQGTHDRPYFLTCQFDRNKIDTVLKSLGRVPWLEHRPRLVMVLAVHGRTNNGMLSSDGAFDPDMREALTNAALRYGLPVSLPNVAVLESNQVDIDTASTTPVERLLKIVALSGCELPLIGDLQWSDAALGWVATWSLEALGQRHHWSVSGVNYDEAFRNAVRGAARVLSGNGEPL